MACLAAALIACAGAATALLHDPAATAAACAVAGGTVAVGQCAPNFTLTDLHGRRERLTAFHGHPVLLNFWGVGCTYCAQEFPALKSFAATFMRHGGVVLGVNTWREPVSLIADYARRNHVAWPLLPDPPDTIGNLYGVNGTPENVFVDRQGVIRAVTFGPLTLRQFEQDARGL
jgi:peroxiredoxin